MSIIKRIIYLTIAVCLCSCQSDMVISDTIYDNNITMGNMVDGVFVTDQGLTYNIVGQLCAGNLNTVKRAMISCDIVSRIDENRYDINLTDFEEIFTKVPVDSTAVSDDSIFLEDPLNFGEIWYSGGYLNMLISIPIKAGSKHEHTINLVRNDAVAEDAIYEFSFKHNADGEVITAADTDFAQANRYVSFPISHLFKEDEQKVKIVLNWTSNLEKDGVWTHETKKNQISLDVERVGYEHKHWE